jgi:hypothetical protein
MVGADADDAVAPCGKQPSFCTTAAYANDDLGTTTVPERFIPLWHLSFPFGIAFTFANCPYNALILKSTLDRDAHVLPPRGTPSWSPSPTSSFAACTDRGALSGTNPALCGRY